jgi:predicted dinucleotide-binding enzyme
VNSRSRDQAQGVLNDLQIKLPVVPIEEALGADIIIPTSWYKDLLPWLQTYRQLLKGKILIDITNPFNETFDDFVTPYHTSSAEEIQKLVPQTAVVGAFKNTYWVVFERPILQGIKSDVYVTSLDEQARRKVVQVLMPFPFRILDAGTLANNRTIERMTLLSRELALKAGNYPRISFNLWGLEHEGLLT